MNNFFVRILLLLAGANVLARAELDNIIINEIYYKSTNNSARTEFIEVYNAGASPANLSGWSLGGGISFTFPEAAPLAPGAYWVIAEDPNALLQTFGAAALGPFSGHLSNEGDTVRLLNNSGKLVNEVKYGIGFPWPSASAGEGSSMELIHPSLDNTLGGNWRASGWVDLPGQPGDGFPEPAARGSGPTPGARNSVYSTTAPPLISDVTHEPAQPTSTNAVRITAKIASPAGVAAVWLQYQVVIPGDYLPARVPYTFSRFLEFPQYPNEWNTRFGSATNWSVVAMSDEGANGDVLAGDGVYTAVLPPMANRSLLRYRIFVQDAGQLAASVAVPYADDPSLNFACFVYDGVPPYQPLYGTVHSDGLGHVYPAQVMNSLPVYFLLTRAEDFHQCNAYEPAYWIPANNMAAREKFNWEGTFVYDGVAYDHVGYRLRKDNDRYNGGARGKRCMRFRFNMGHYLVAKDNQGNSYPEKWRTLNTGNLFSNLQVGNFGLVETLNSGLWNLLGVPSPLVHTFHFRVVQNRLEAPDDVYGQFNGDFMGMYLAMEDYDSIYLKTHKMADGNLYKLKDSQTDGNKIKRHQGELSVKDDADFQNIHRNLTPDKSDDWLRNYVNYDKCYLYHAVCEAVRHYDFAPADPWLKNRAWYFEPSLSEPLGRLWTMPWDFDFSWGPCWDDVDGGYDYSSYAILAKGGKPAFKLEYRNAIRQFRDLVWTEEVINSWLDSLAAQISEFSQADRDRWKDDYYGLDFGPLANKVQDMKNFAFVGWSGSTGATVPAGGRAAFLDKLAAAEGEGDLIPATPTITAINTNVFSLDNLTFNVSAFADPQGADTFGALEWRLAEVTDASAPAYDPAAPRLFEWNAVWQSGELTNFAPSMTIPSSAVSAGKAYRVRARMKDNTGRWSHWSAPLQFVAVAPVTLQQLQSQLRITEIMYHPPGGDAYEFVELLNADAQPLDISGVWFDSGITFSFSHSAVSLLAPRQRIVLVRDYASFLSRYPHSGATIAGQFEGKLSNDGDTLRLACASAEAFLAVSYKDSWYPETDGNGYSLVLRDPEGTADATSKEAWRPSLIPYGSPGTTDEAQDRDGDLIPDYYEIAQGLNPEDPADASLDADADGESALNEYFAGTNPHDGKDEFNLDIQAGGTNVWISFKARATDPVYYPNLQRLYVIERYGSDHRWTTITPSIIGANQTVKITDTLSAATPFYRAKAWLQEN